MHVDDLLSPPFDYLEEDENDHDGVDEEIKEREHNIYYERCINPNAQRESFGSDANPPPYWPQSNEYLYQFNVRIAPYDRCMVFSLQCCYWRTISIIA